MILKAIINTGRLVINTTVGILGLFDVAQYFGLTKYEKEDYGQLLENGELVLVAMLCLPVLGPSTIEIQLVLLQILQVVILGIMLQ